jgi:hypothetical protein
MLAFPRWHCWCILSRKPTRDEWVLVTANISWLPFTRSMTGDELGVFGADRVLGGPAHILNLPPSPFFGVITPFPILTWPCGVHPLPMLRPFLVLQALVADRSESLVLDCLKRFPWTCQLLSRRPFSRIRLRSPGYRRMTEEDRRTASSRSRE